MINGAKMYFRYDEAGRPLSVTYGSLTYYYILNQQGDVVGLRGTDGATAVNYKYDAWGNIISITDANGNAVTSGIGITNPLRYRGYFYDTETKLYYLQSRYYSPELRRFICGDIGIEILKLSLGQVISANLFVYCKNNPIAYSDARGLWYENLEQYIKSGNKPTTYGNSKIKLQIKGNSIFIKASIGVYGNLISKKVDGYYYNQLILDGIEEYWSGSFALKVFKVYLQTDAIQLYRNNKKNGIIVNTVDKYGISNVRYPLLGWSNNNFGTVTLYKGDRRTNHKYSASEFKYVVAHEFGHLLGLDDLDINYNCICIMSYFGAEVKSHNVNDFLYAFANNRAQRARNCSIHS